MYIKDIVDFINKIESFMLLFNVLLIIYDVISMYINMEFNEFFLLVYEVYM